ncbi:MAG: restriction endonuclease subunit S [Fibrobacter sp.]|nr:restriction endonuclease subunit S [Fibrobacter sp.]MDD5942026.1 restriction endonuclease subunit S [Fibrobacter sp.]
MNNEEVRWMTLGECCDMKAGKAISSLNIYTETTKEAPIPCYGGNGLRGYVSKSNQNGNFCLIGRQGALCGNVCYATGKFYATEHAVVVKNNTSLNSRFLFHLLTNMNLNQYKSQGAQPGLAVGKLEEIKIPVPSLALQEKIANVLDNFDAVCNDLNIGLPAEISLRKKQYEYYRDRILSFNTNVNNSIYGGGGVISRTR